MLALRKEVKMGAAIGLTVLGIAGVYGLMASLSSGDHGQTASSNVDSGQANEQGRGGLPPADPAPVAPAPTPVAPVKPAADPFAESNRTDGNKHNDSVLTALSTGRLGGDMKPQSSSSSTRLDGPLVTPAPTPAATKNPLVTPINDAKTSGDDNMLVDLKPTDAKTEKPTPADAPAGGKYVVQSGDTFSTIAAKVYGSKKFYAALAKANPDVNPSRLRIGKQINVPAKESLQSARGSIEADRPTLTQPIDASRQYRVAAGDTLSRIATKLYGKAGMWETIYNANKATIGPDAARLKLGTVLELPEKPKADAIAR